jgi:predicted ester cyclase
MSDYDNKQIYALWIKAWNEDITILSQITDPDCEVHQARVDGKPSEKLKGLESLETIISEGSSFFRDIKMTLEVGPIVEGDYISARWNFFGIYQGGMKGAKTKVGEKISFSGIDIFRIKEGKIREYWVSSDGVHLMKQLGIF